MKILHLLCCVILCSIFAGCASVERDALATQYTETIGQDARPGDPHNTEKIARSTDRFDSQFNPFQQAAFGMCREAEAARDHCEFVDLAACTANLKTCRADLKTTKTAREDDIAVDKINLTVNLPNFLKAFEHALNSLGYLGNGHDGIYDGKTAEAVKKLQFAESEEETGWATPQQIRHAVCTAAVGDPLSQQPRNGDYESRINLAIFYTEGIGYAKDLSKAKYLVRTVIDDLITELNKPGLPAAEEKRLKGLLANANAQDQGNILRPVRVRSVPRAYSFDDLCPKPKPNP